MIIMIISALTIHSQVDLHRQSHLKLPLHGTVYDGRLYGFFGEREDGFSLFSIETRNPGAMPARQYAFFDFAEVSLWYRHHIRSSELWIGHGPVSGVRRLSFDDVEYFDRFDKDGLKLRTFHNKYGFPANPVEPSLLKLPALAKKDRERHDPKGPFGGPAKGICGFGWVPLENNICKSFLLLKENRTFEVWDTQHLFAEKAKRWEVVSDEHGFESFDSPFTEDFYVFVQNQAYFFVTESGSLFHAPPLKKGEKRKVQALWENAKKPISAVLEDADSDKVWLFAKDRTEGMKLDWFFEMKDEIHPHSFDRTALRPAKVKNRAKNLLEYLPLITNQKR